VEEYSDSACNAKNRNLINYMSKIIALYEDISRLVIGQVEKEDESTIFLKNPALVATRSSEVGKFQIDFVPLEMNSIDPHPIPLRAMCKPGFEVIIKFDKSDLYIYDVPLMDNIVENYRNAPFVRQDGKPENNIVKLF
jgi:hypothetical protein